MKDVLMIVVLLIGIKGCFLNSKESELWYVKAISSNYIQKGPLDKFELPNNVIGSKLLLVNDTLTIVKETGLSSFCNDTLILGPPISLNVRADDEISKLYPGDELTCLSNDNAGDSCYLSKSFQTLLGTNEKKISVHRLSTSNGQKTTCVLFVIEKNKQLVLFNSNDFLIMRLEKRI